MRDKKQRCEREENERVKERNIDRERRMREKKEKNIDRDRRMRENKEKEREITERDRYSAQKCGGIILSKR